MTAFFLEKCPARIVRQNSFLSSCSLQLATNGRSAMSKIERDKSNSKFSSRSGARVVAQQHHIAFLRMRQRTVSVKQLTGRMRGHFPKSNDSGAIQECMQMVSRMGNFQRNLCACFFVLTWNLACWSNTNNTAQIRYIHMPWQYFDAMHVRFHHVQVVVVNLL